MPPPLERVSQPGHRSLDAASTRPAGEAKTGSGEDLDAGFGTPHTAVNITFLAALLCLVQPAGVQPEISKDVRRRQRSLYVFRFWEQLVEGKTAAGKPHGDILLNRATEGELTNS